MPRRHRHRTMRGGFLDTLSNWGASLSQSASNLWEKTKSATSSATSELTGTSSTSVPSYSSTNTSYTQPMTTSTYGGKSRRRRRMKGGFKDNTGSSTLAANAAPFSGETARAHNIVGGRTRRRRKHKHSKSCKHRKH